MVLSSVHHSQNLVRVESKRFLWCVFMFVGLMFSYSILNTVDEYFSLSISDNFRHRWYFITTDLSFILISLCGYFGLSYTSILNKGVMLSIVIFTIGIMISNIMVLFDVMVNQVGSALFAGFMILSLLLFCLRFISRIEDGDHYKPQPDKIYLIVNKPRSFYEFLGLLWSAIGGGFTIYHNDFTYWFSREKGVLIKSHDPDWYKGRRMLFVCFATPENIQDLETLPGLKWSIWNNCVFTPLRFKRRWS